MTKLLRKALERGLTPANAASYICLEIMRIFGGFWGTLRLRLKAFILGVELGDGVTAHGPVGLLRWPGGRIRIGAGASLISSWRRTTAATVGAPVRLRVFGPGASIEIGEGAQLSGSSITVRSTCVRIGRKVLLAPNCVVVDSDFHAPWPMEERADNPGYENDAPVVIGDYVWIGMNSLVLKGVTIGEGAVIGAGSLVCRDVPPQCLAAGVPARVIKRISAGNAETMSV
jgi:acetyltransferase-like isoleucine patch superfamily enzyme